MHQPSARHRRDSGANAMVMPDGEGDHAVQISRDRLHRCESTDPNNLRYLH
ncbi:hypothetical protein NSU_2046 [Novosphingobium pentaromativorans US6-1]|uniref:Uncharacterized protein n=1 Tax=Novosphingobium pentaromativorans US6-1 TaxID=1088721 RepID=G6ECH5_9SPHN|nr:hypothetical protein NSU_2046 [Novosphingobium pentaromativorans US6-1]